MPQRDIQFFPIEFLELNAEITHHHDLITYLYQVRIDSKDSSLELMLSSVAAWLGILLDGAYTQDDLKRLATILTEKLRDKRTQSILILPSSTIQ